jgi:RHS repeat-associated protein
VDTLVLRDQSSLHNGTLDQRLYVQQDANGNVTALVNTTGSVLERYAYDPYGAVTVLSPGWSALGASAYGAIYLWQDKRYDGSVGLYDSRGRVYSPTLMRPMQADPLGLGPDVNDYRWEGDRPTCAIDPSGLKEDRKLIAEAPTQPWQDGTTGSFVYPIVWRLTQPAGSHGGAIIQLVESEIKVWDNRGVFIGTYKSKFYEAWYVQPGTSGPAAWWLYRVRGSDKPFLALLNYIKFGIPCVSVNDDTFTMVLNPKARVGRYEYTVTAKAWYLEGVTGVAYDNTLEGSLLAIGSPMAGALAIALQPYLFYQSGNPHTNAGRYLPSVPSNQFTDREFKILVRMYGYTSAVKHLLKAKWDRTIGNQPIQSIDPKPVLPIPYTP